LPAMMRNGSIRNWRVPRFPSLRSVGHQCTAPKGSAPAGP
jgi:hypothetical protein